jgi:hypothetical protein
MGKKRRRSKNKDPRFSPYPIPEDFFNPLGRFLVPPKNPPGFGTVRPELEFQTPLVTGELLFDDPFYSKLSPPPLGRLDPCYPEYEFVLEKSQNRIEKCPAGGETTPECVQARKEYIAAARTYAYRLDRVWGLNRFAKEAEDFRREQELERKGKGKKRT